jgi:hypothetical protein
MSRMRAYSGGRGWAWRVMAVSIAVLLGAADPTPALAMPPLPSSFYGTVTINGANAPLGAKVSAKIKGTQYAYTTVLLYQGQTVYSLDVPGDDPATPSVIEGGVPGDTVAIWVGETPANETAPWRSGTNVTLNLTAASSPPLDHKTFLPLISKQ